MKHKKILVIEDDYLDVISLQRALNKLNIEHTVVVAHNGEEALGILTGTSEKKMDGLPDMIFLDINMPKMNGLEFLRIIRNYYTLKSIPVYIMTTSLEEYDLNEAKKLSISGYLIKPLDFEKQKEKHPNDAIKYLTEELLK